MMDKRTLIYPSLLLVTGLTLTAIAGPPRNRGGADRSTRRAGATQVASTLAARRRRLPLLAFRGGVRWRRRPVKLVPSFHPPRVVERYRRTIQGRNLALKPDQAARIATSVLDASDRNDLDSRLVLALVATESNFRPTAVSHAGALGLGQLMPRTAASLGVTDPFDTDQNVEGSAEVLGAEIDRLATRHGRKKPAERDIHMALACYNAGPGAVRRYGGVPPFRETNHYVKRVTGLYYQFAGPGGLPPVGQPLWP